MCIKLFLSVSELTEDGIFEMKYLYIKKDKKEHGFLLQPGNNNRVCYRSYSGYMLHISYISAGQLTCYLRVTN